MLPKIIVIGTEEKEQIYSDLGLSSGSTMEFEGVGGKIDELRRFVNFSINVSVGFSNFNLLIWNADRLSPECQTVLLKPLEESADNYCLILLVTNENGLIPTILSRCVVSNLRKLKAIKSNYWKNILECFAKGPAKCLALADELDKVEMEKVLEEVIDKLKAGLANEVNKNRLKILKLAIDCLAKIRFTNVNAKLAFGNFLIYSWRLIKT